MKNELNIVVEALRTGVATAREAFTITQWTLRRVIIWALCWLPVWALTPGIMDFLLKGNVQ